MAKVINFSKANIIITNDELTVILDTIEDIAYKTNQISYFLGYKTAKDKNSHLAQSLKNIATPLINKIQEYTDATKK